MPKQMDPSTQVRECALDPLSMQILHHQHQIMIMCQRLIELTRLMPPDVETMLARNPDRLGMGG